MEQYRITMTQHATGGERGGRPPQWGPALEAAGMLALIMVDIWWVEPRRPMAWLALVALVVASHVRRGETPSSLGFRRANLRRCLVAIGPLLLGVAAIALVLSVTFGTVRRVPPGRLAGFVAYYCVWGLFQQYALNGYFVNRFAAAAPGRRIGLVPPVAAGCFALVHAPNWFLVGVTFGAGLLCAHFYLKYRNLFPLGVAHGLLGSVLFLSVPDTVSQHFYIGPAALRWQRAHRQLDGCDGRDHPFAVGCAPEADAGPERRDRHTRPR
jgi:hypothetical protein